MGNKAVITTKAREIGIYLHWNGGRSSIEAFLEYCRNKGFSPPEKDPYGWVMLVRVISNFCGAVGHTIIVDRLEKLNCDNGDNGLYVIEDWKIVEREFLRGNEQPGQDMGKLLREISEAQPKQLKMLRKGGRGKKLLTVTAILDMLKKTLGSSRIKDRARERLRVYYPDFMRRQAPAPPRRTAERAFLNSGEDFHRGRSVTSKS
jgi:hypothetical protein